MRCTSGVLKLREEEMRCLCTYVRRGGDVLLVYTNVG
jgi:hypothetical protein